MLWKENLDIIGDGLCVMSVVVGYSSLLVVVGIDSEYMWENIYPNGCVRI